MKTETKNLGWKILNYPFPYIIHDKISLAFLKALEDNKIFMIIKIITLFDDNIYDNFC